MPLPTMSDPITTWLKHLEVNRRYSGHTLSAYRRDLQQLVTLAEGKPLEQLVLAQKDGQLSEAF